MTMTENEIVRNYREAKNKRQQIEILADLNAISQDEIKAILKKNGVDLRGGNYRAKKPAVINQDFEDAVNEMIEDSKNEPEQEPIPECVQWLINLGMQQLDIQIAEKDKELRRIMDELEDLKAKKIQVLSHMHKIHPDNNGNLWYRDATTGQTVIVEE